MRRWNGNVMTLKHFQDFYYLEALRAKLSMAKFARPEQSFRKAFVLLEEDVNRAFDTLCERMALHIYVYLWVAALGEAWHANDFCDERIAEQEMWTDSDALKYFPSEDNVEILSVIFDQSWSGGCYGGEAWLNIVEGMSMYNNVPHATFIDHAVDLEHNGGNVFDKTSGGTCGMECFDPDYSRSSLKLFLDLKFQSDILNDNEYKNMWGHTREIEIEVSPKVYTLITRYHNIVENVRAVDFLKPKLEWLTRFSVDWDYEEFSITDSTGGMSCEWCGSKIDEDNSYYFRNEDICSYCYDKKVTSCDKCHEAVLKNDTDTVLSGKIEQEWCPSCKYNHAVECEKCGELVDVENNTHRTEDDYTVCIECGGDMHCAECDEFYYEIDEHNAEEHPQAELPADADGISESIPMEA